MSGLGSMMAGGNPATGRQDDDFYPTPREVTEALLRYWRFDPAKPIHECACGDGAMAKVIEAHGFTVIASDLVDRGYGIQQDFLKMDRALAPVVITNPPFNLAVDFITHALDDLQVGTLALVLKSTFWHAKNRYALFNRHRPRAVLPLLWRPDFLGRGRPTMECAWCVWDRGYTGATLYHPLPKPN